MYSPFYVLEQQRLYPHRTKATTAQEVATEISNLIANNITTLVDICKTPTGELRTMYFPMCNSSFVICDGIQIYKKSL